MVQAFLCSLDKNIYTLMEFLSSSQHHYSPPLHHTLPSWTQISIRRLLQQHWWQCIPL